MRYMKEVGRFAGVVSWERGKRWSMDGKDSSWAGCWTARPCQQIQGQLSMTRGQCVGGSHD